MDDPPYILLARQAEIWLNGEAEKKATIWRISVSDENVFGQIFNSSIFWHISMQEQQINVYPTIMDSKQTWI
jgi:hypothetical protein